MLILCLILTVIFVGILVISVIVENRKINKSNRKYNKVYKDSIEKESKYNSN